MIGKGEMDKTAKRKSTMEERAQEDGGRTRTADKGQRKSGANILNTRGFTKDTRREKKDEPLERPTDTNGQTGSNRD